MKSFICKNSIKKIDFEKNNVPKSCRFEFHSDFLLRDGSLSEKEDISKWPRAGVMAVAWQTTVIACDVHFKCGDKLF